MSTPRESEPIETQGEASVRADDAVVEDATVMKRRHFLRVAASAAAATGGLGTAVIAQEPPVGRGGAAGRGGGGGGRGGGAGAGGGGGGGGGRGGQPEAPPIPLAQNDPPALQFQAYPGGTGALMEKLMRERGAAAFERKPIEISPWQGPVPTREEDVVFLPAHRLGALLKERRISSVDLTNMYLERMKRYDPVLLCAVTILEGRAREEAQQADAEIRAGNWKGPLHGVPWGVKDLFAVKGAPTTWGSADFRNQTFDYDSELVVRLRNAGAVLMAKLSTGEFAQGANWFRGRTNNPWNIQQSSSGSSAGPGSATAAGCVGFSIGTETQGSIVGPSTTCGLSALRPTFGTISRHGGMVLSWTMDKPGPMCRSIEDVALVFNVVHGADPKDPATVTTPFEFRRLPNLNGIRVGYAPNSPEAFLNDLRTMGATVSPLPTLPNITSPSIGVEGAAAMESYIDEKLRVFEENGGDPVPPRFQNGRTPTALEYLQAQRRRWLLMQQWDELLQGLDVYVGGLGASNQTGHPAVVLPYTFGSTTNAQGVVSHEQPRCVTIFGPVFSDDALLSVGQAYQIQHDWHLRRPNISLG